MIILTILLFAGIGTFVAQSIASKQSLDTGSRAAEERPRFTPVPTETPTPLPTGKPEVLGAFIDNSADFINNNQTPNLDRIVELPSTGLNNAVMPVLIGVLLITDGIILSSFRPKILIKSKTLIISDPVSNTGI